MANAQSAICTTGETCAVFLTLLVGRSAQAIPRLRGALARLAALTRDVAIEVEEPNLASAAGIGLAAWPRLFDTPPPVALAPFPEVSDGPRRAPATPADLFVHIHAHRHDAAFLLARRLLALVGDAAHIVEEVHGFRTLGHRDLTGFVDGTENPKGDEIPQVALVGGEDPAFAGGSYVSIQRWVHDLARWEHMPVGDQEAIVGRSKRDDVEMEDDAKPPSAHIARVVIEDEEGEELAVLRHSLPYGTTKEHGLYFVAYGRTPDNFRRMLQRMVVRDEEGAYDRLMDFTHPATGASFFCPSLDFLEGLT